MRFILLSFLLVSPVDDQSLVISGGSGSFAISGHTQPPVVVVEPVKPVVVEEPEEFVEVQPAPKKVIKRVAPQVQPPNRYIMWPGWGRIDLATYNRNCNCGMCQSIRGYQARYRQELRAYQAALAKPRYDPEAIVASQQATPDAVVEQVVDALALTKDDVLADLGCGDGRILIAATKRYGCRGIGIEIEPAIAETARRRVADSGLSDKIQILTGDAVTFDPSSHSVTAITAYLYPELLEKLTPVFKGKTVRVVASPYHQVPGLQMQKTGEVFVYRRPVAQVVAKPKRRYLAMFTANYCGPCQQWKSTQKSKIESKGFVVLEYEMTNPVNSAKYGSRIRSLPTFVVCDYDTGEWLSAPMVGSRSSIDILPFLAPPNTNQTVLVTPDAGKTSVLLERTDNPTRFSFSSKSQAQFRNPSLFGDSSGSHQSRETLIHHLLNDGIHRGRYTINQLQAMSDDALNAAHEKDHQGVR